MGNELKNEPGCKVRLSGLFDMRILRSCQSQSAAELLVLTSPAPVSPWGQSSASSGRLGESKGDIVMLSIFCSTTRYLGSQLSSKNSTDCIAAAPRCLQWSCKDQVADLWQFDLWSFLANCFCTGYHAEQAVALRTTTPPQASVVWASPEGGWKREAGMSNLDVETGYVLTTGTVTPSTLMLAFSSFKTVLAHKQAEWQQSALWTTLMISMTLCLS